MATDAALTTCLKAEESFQSVKPIDSTPDIHQWNQPGGQFIPYKSPP